MMGTHLPQTAGHATQPFREGAIIPISDEIRCCFTPLTYDSVSLTHLTDGAMVWVVNGGTFKKHRVSAIIRMEDSTRVYYGDCYLTTITAESPVEWSDGALYVVLSESELRVLISDQEVPLQKQCIA